MPGSATYARLEKECEVQIKNLSGSANIFDDPIDPTTLPHYTGVNKDVKRFKDNGVGGIDGARSAAALMAKECHTRFLACQRYEAALAAYEQSCRAYRAASDAYASSLRQHQDSKSTGPGPTPPSGPGAAPVPPPYWSRD